jgi:hypothetical protein
MAEPADQILTIGLSAVAGYGGKVPHEVGATTGALGRLEARLSEICGWSSSRRP